MGEKLFSFETNDEISSEHGFNDTKFPFDHGKENNYFMLQQKFLPLQEYEKSTEESEYEYLYKMDDKMKGGKNTIENEGIVESGDDFINCEIIHSKP